MQPGEEEGGRKKPGPKPGQKQPWALPAGTRVATGRCPGCGRPANVKATRTGRLMLICPHAIEETLEPCNTKLQLGLPQSKALSERYAGGEREIVLEGRREAKKDGDKKEGERDGSWW